MRPRPLFLDHTGQPGGAELCLLDIAGHFRESCEVVLFSDGPFRLMLEKRGVVVEVIEGGCRMSEASREGRLLQALAAGPAAIRVALSVARKARDFDLLFANSQKAAVIGSIAAAISRKPLVWYLHDMISADHFSSLNRRIDTLVGERVARRILVNSTATQEAYLETAGRRDRAKGTPVVVVYTAIDSHPYLNAKPDGLREALGLNGKPLLGMFSRIARWKGQDVVLDAIRETPDVHVLFVGGALFGDEKRCEQELRKHAGAIGVADRVHWLGFRDDVPALMKACDIVLHASTAPEPFGRVIVEGMFAGKPVIAARAGGVLEIISDNETGVLFESGNPAALAGCIRHLLANPEKANAIAEAGHRSALDRFSLERMLEAVSREMRMCRAES